MEEVAIAYCHFTGLLKRKSKWHKCNLTHMQLRDTGAQALCKT